MCNRQWWEPTQGLRAIRLAFQEIEVGNYTRYAVACRGAMHRSVAAACLLLQVAFPRGRLAVTTTTNSHNYFTSPTIGRECALAADGRPADTPPAAGRE